MVTGLPYYFGDDGAIPGHATATMLPNHPPDYNEWFSDDVRDLICKCRSPSRGSRPDLNLVMDVLDEAGDAAELRRRGIEEEDLIHLLKNYRGGHKNVQKAEVQRMADMLGSVSRFRNQVSRVT